MGCSERFSTGRVRAMQLFWGVQMRLSMPRKTRRLQAWWVRLVQIAKGGGFRAYVSKGSPAHGTFVRLFACVGALVNRSGTCLDELLGTESA